MYHELSLVSSHTAICTAQDRQEGTFWVRKHSKEAGNPSAGVVKSEHTWG